MSDMRDVLRVAELLLRQLGDDAPAEMVARAAAHRMDGDAQSALFWARVGRAMNALIAERERSTPPRDVASLPDRAFRDAFDASPNAYLLLTPDLVIAAANPEYLALTMTSGRDILGAGMFDVFPDNPGNAGADGAAKLSESLARVLDTGKRHVMARQRYDLRDRDGVFHERWWEPVNSPVFDGQGRLALIMHHVRDVTGQVLAAA